MPTETQRPETVDTSKLLQLPDAPAQLTGSVKAWRQPVEMLTYLPDDPELNPMFLEKRVYQGSSGRVYPLPFIDRIATEPTPKMWDAIHIENEFMRLMILPEIGGRIHIGYDKTTGYDFFYRQNVIKPALVGLAGPWISGGVEFNWPQHHRPATFMPVETEIEHGLDGSITVWCGDHDPMLRMKGMHGVCLNPGRAVLELKVRLYNRTQFTQTFLWWANVATRVHEKYQSFFPTDVRFVADHAKRAVTSFPQSSGNYYGVNYSGRAASGVPTDEQPSCFVPDSSCAANDLSWYANIPVPTSYMITSTEDDFFGGYDHKVGAGVVHVANHHIAPGKKQWTWGNHEFGYAWDRSLTDHDGPYIELMAGVYTDNQPDFSYLAPWETKTFTQNWFPIHAIGVPQSSSLDGALSLQVKAGQIHVGVYVTHDIGESEVLLQREGNVIERRSAYLEVAAPLVFSIAAPSEAGGDSYSVRVTVQGRVLLSYDPSAITPAKAPTVAVEPPSPAEIGSTEELYLTGVHLNQYHHATRQPELYWEEALRRDPEDSRVNNALGLWRLRRGEIELAVTHFETAIKRLTRLNPNPYDGEAYYNLGITERYGNNDKLAYDAFYKATWNATWRGPAYFALAEIDSKRQEWSKAREHLIRSLKAEADNLLARNLLVYVLEKLGDVDEAAERHLEIRALDPLDLTSRFRDGLLPESGQDCLDLAFDLLRSGQKQEAMDVLRAVKPKERGGSLPIALFALARTEAELQMPSAGQAWDEAYRASLDYCFPARLEELLLLEAAKTLRPDEAAPSYLLGNWLYDRRRHEEAIQMWETSARLDPERAAVWRNLGIANFNVRHDEAAAKTCFNYAMNLNPTDGRVLYERDQLWKRTGVEPATRLAELTRYPDLVAQRDDLSLESATLRNQVGEPEKALEILLARRFQPWEGGEGLVLGQYVRAQLLLGRRALHESAPKRALEHFRAALEAPHNLSEAKHLLVNQSDIFYWVGTALEALGRHSEAAAWWRRAANQRGDFQQMAVRFISDMTYWAGMARSALGEDIEAEKVFREIYDYAKELERTEPKIDYFATSLPAMLLFDEDLNARNQIEAFFLAAQGLTGLKRLEEARGLLKQVLKLDSNHAGAADLLRQVDERAVEMR